MSKKLLSLYGLKWNPFGADLPTEALLTTARISSLCWRVEHLCTQGGFAQIWGDPGTGKSAALRILLARLAATPDITVGVLARPQAHLADFYRELGYLFGVALTPHNRWAGAKALRERWQAHIEASLARPVLLIDEAQEMLPSVLAELRLLSSTDLDSRQVLTVVLAGDSRLADKLRTPELLPVASRIRTRLRMESLSATDLLAHLKHAVTQAGNPKLMTAELMNTLAEHAAGNLRVMMGLADELLATAIERDADTIDEKLFLELHDVALSAPRGRKAGSR